MYAMNRTNVRGLQYQLMEMPDGKTRITCNGKHIIVDENIHRISQAWFNWQMRGEKIQVAFMFFKPEEREFLLTGLTPEEWAAIFAEEEDRN